MDAKLQNFCEFAKTDSFKLSVPLDKTGLSIYTDLIQEQNINTGEIESEKYKRQIYKNDLPTGEKIRILPSKCGKKFEIGINSKFLQKDYFNGININNIDKAIDFVCNNITDKNFKLNKYTLLDFGTITDLDICNDVQICDSADAYYLYKYTELNFKNGAYIPNNYSIFPKNAPQYAKTGFQVLSRASQSVSYPFLKLYHKGKEMLSQSYSFYKSNLSNYNLDYLNRTEINITGKGLDNILDNRTILNVLSQDPNYIFERQMLKHFKTVNVPVTEYKKLYTNNSDIVIHVLLSKLNDENPEYLENASILIRDLTSSIPCRKSKMRYENNINRIIQNIKYGM
jgi:hypothetical protein